LRYREMLQKGGTMRRRFLLCFTLLFLGMAAGGPAAAQTTYLPYVKAGYLFTPPSAADLDYVAVGGGSLDEFLTVHSGNFGVGAQMYLQAGSFGIQKQDLRMGIDLGFQRLFGARFESNEADLSYIDQAYSDENEWGLNALALAHYAPAELPVFFQVGLGPSLVFWQWKYVYHSIYQDTENVESGSEVNLGILLAVGMTLKAGNTEIPVMFRVDDVFRYGSTATASVMVGMIFGP